MWADNSTDIHRIEISSTHLSRVRFVDETDSNYQQVSTRSSNHHGRRRSTESDEKSNSNSYVRSRSFSSSRSSSNSKETESDVQIDSMESTTTEANRDMKRFTNYFYDERLEESYQLYSSTCDLPVARKIILFIFFYEMAMYLMFLYYDCTSTINNSTSTSTTTTTKATFDDNGLHKISTKCTSMPVPIEMDKSYDYILWAFGPFAILFSFFPMKWLEETMRLRIVVYYFRRRWKRMASLITLLWTIGANIYIIKYLSLLKEAHKTKLQKELSCEANIFVPLPFNQEMTLLDWMILNEMEFSDCMSMAVLALFVTIAGIIAVSLKIDFPHVFFVCFSLAMTILFVLLTSQNKFSKVSSTVQQAKSTGNTGTNVVLLLPVTVGQEDTTSKMMVFLYVFCTFLPMGFTLFATYMEDRSSRMAYVSRMRAERMNTTLKLDLSVKQVGLINQDRNMTKEEQKAMEEVFLLGSNENESVLLKELSIPFSDLKLKEFLLTPSRVSSSSSSTTTTTTTTISLKDDLLLAEYHGIQVVFKRLCLISSSCCFTRKRLQEFKEKSKLLGCLRHPNIIQLIGITYDNFTNIGLIMEYLEKKDVYSLLRCRNHHIQLTWNDPLLQIAIDVAQGMSYLHHFDPPIVHRDLKTSNLLCTATFTCKISDFNEAKHERISLLNTIVGTPYWLAPEILREEKYDTKVDCYSFGIVLIELETRQDPFVEYKEINTIDFLIRVAKGELKPNIPMTCTKNRRLLIERCLDFDPKKRPQMTDILFSLQHEIREEIIGNVLLENDQRRVLLLQRHQMLNRYGVKDLLSSTY